MTLEALKNFIENNDFGFASANGSFCAICDNEDRERLLENIGKWNSPQTVEGEKLADVLLHFPEFNEEIDNGCRILSCEVYDGSNLSDTYYFAVYE